MEPARTTRALAERFSTPPRTWQTLAAMSVAGRVPVSAEATAAWRRRGGGTPGRDVASMPASPSGNEDLRPETTLDAVGPLMSPAERSAWIEVYLRAGWCLVRLRPGSKIPAKPAWNEPEQLVRTCPQARDAFRDTRVGIGAHLGASGLCSVDLDALDAAQVALGAVGVDANDVIKAGWQIVSGKPNKARAMFRVPEGVPLTLRRLRIPLPEAEWHKGAPRLGVVLELRCGEVQDVLPPSIHPDTKRPYVAGAIPSPFPSSRPRCSTCGVAGTSGCR